MIFLCFSCRSILISLTAVIGKPSFSFSSRTLKDICTAYSKVTLILLLFDQHCSEVTFLSARSSPFSISISGGGVALYTSPYVPSPTQLVQSFTLLHCYICEVFQAGNLTKNFELENFLVTLSTILYMSTQRSPQSRPSSVIGPT